MTIMTPARRFKARAHLRQFVHNDTAQVKLRWKETTVQSNPNIKGSPQPSYTAAIAGFPCRVTQIESGKLNRIFRHRMGELTLPEGFWDNVAYEITYIDGLYELLLLASVVTNAAPSDTELFDAAVPDFTALTIRNGDGYIKNTTDGSWAKIVTIEAGKITTEALAEGTLNLYTAGDDYELYLPTLLSQDDQIYAKGKWRTVLLDVQDSEHIQRTAFVSD